MSDWLFNTPWWLPTLISAVGVILFLSGNKRLDATLKRLGLAVLGLGILLAAVSYFVETDKEKVESRTRLLVKSANDRDWATFKSLLDPNTSFLIFSGPDAIVTAAQNGVERFDVKNIRITGMNIKQTDSVITADIACLTEATGTGMTNWRLTWQKNSSGWFLYQVELLPSMGVQPEEVQRRIAR